MQALILQHPRAKAMLKDPRDLYGSDHPIEGNYALPQPGVSDPIYIQALRGEVLPATCAGCGQPRDQHYEASGHFWIGCHGVPARKAVAQLIPRPIKETAVWGDAHPKVSQAIRDLLLAACGQDVAYFYEGLGHEAQINLSRRLAEGAVVALRMEDAE